MDSSISEFENIHCCKLGLESKINNCMAISVDPDETAISRLIWIYTVCIGICTGLQG